MSKDKNKVIKCPECGRYDFLSVYRKTTIIEYRLIDTNVNGYKQGLKPFKGNWKREQTTISKTLGVRCMACETELRPEEIEGISETNIEKNGVSFVLDTDWW